MPVARHDMLLSQQHLRNDRGKNESNEKESCWHIFRACSVRQRCHESREGELTKDSIFDDEKRKAAECRLVLSRSLPEAGWLQERTHFLGLLGPGWETRPSMSSCTWRAREISWYATIHILIFDFLWGFRHALLARTRNTGNRYARKPLELLGLTHSTAPKVFSKCCI
jgi:hypothetical protein